MPPGRPRRSRGAAEGASARRSKSAVHRSVSASASESAATRRPASVGRGRGRGGLQPRLRAGRTRPR
eukprot:9469117-Pyramimonas_sp.AAC.1